MARRRVNTKLTEQLIIRAEKMSREGNFDTVICQALGISRQAWYRWLSDGEKILNNEPTSIEYTPEFKRLICDFYYTIKKAQGEHEADLLGLITTEARAGTWQAAAWILERKYRARWAREVETTQEGESALEKFLDGVDELAEEADTDGYEDPLGEEADGTQAE